jgi:hypothetical protein
MAEAKKADDNRNARTEVSSSILPLENARWPPGVKLAPKDEADRPSVLLFTHEGQISLSGT